MNNVERIRKEVADEAIDAGERRRTALYMSGATHSIPVIKSSNDLQRVTISNDPSWLRNGIYVNWPKTWNRLCDRAAQAGKRPIPFLIDIIEDYLNGTDAG